MKNMTKKYGNWALVTGASQGIGKATAEQLAKAKMNLVIVARSEATLNTVAKELTSKYKIEIKVLAADLSLTEGIAKLFEATKEIEVGLLVANAGIESSGEFLHNDLEINQKIIALNINAPMVLSHHYGRLMVQRGKGGILLVSSLFGYQGVPYVANYSASKAYILTLGEALNVELKPMGIDVTVLAPGLTDTPMAANMPVDFNKMPIIRQSPEMVSQNGLAALGRKATIVSGLINKIYAWENRIIPRSWPVKLFGFLVKRALTKPLFFVKAAS